MKQICLFTAAVIVCHLTASQTVGQYVQCVEAFKQCSACQQQIAASRSATGISADSNGKCIVTEYGSKATDPGASESLKACQRCLDDLRTHLTISLDRPGNNQLFTQGDDFPISGRVTRTGEGVPGVRVNLNLTTPSKSTAVGLPTELETDANGSFTWPGYFTADAAVGNWSLTATAQIIGGEKSAPARRDFTVKKLELSEEQVTRNMGTIVGLWMADPSIPNGIEQDYIEELWRPRGPKVNFREWRDSARFLPYTCSVLANKTLRFLNGLRFHPRDRVKRLLFGGLDYGPVSDGTGNIHVAVALFPHKEGFDYDWTSGHVLEPWWDQKKEYWSGTSWKLTFLGTDLKNGMGELGNFWKGEYPTSGSGGGYYPNPEHVPHSISGPGRVAVITYSPVEDLITDSQGRRVGRLPNNAFVNEIPEAQHAHAVLNDGTFLNSFVVPGGQYRVTVRGTGNGVFHLMTTSTTQTMSYGEQPIAAGQELTFTLNSEDLNQPLMLTDGRQVMPQPLRPEGGEAADGRTAAGAVIAKPSTSGTPPSAFGPMQYGQDIADAADYKALDLSEPRAELCEAECARDPRCRAYAYVRPGTYNYPRPRCWLKEKTGRFIPHANAISAIKNAGGSSTGMGVDEVLPPSRTAVSFIGSWLFRGIAGQNCLIESAGQNRFKAVTEKGVVGYGYLENTTTIVIDFPFASGLRGSISADGNRITWANGEGWTRSIN